MTIDLQQQKMEEGGETFIQSHYKVTNLNYFHCVTKV